MIALQNYKNEIDIHAFFQEMFDKWCVEKNIKNSKISVPVYVEKNIIFPSVDTWKSASKDDYYTEKEVTKSVNIDDFMEVAENIWMTEIGMDGVLEAEKDEDFLYQESCSLFTREYNKYLEKEIDNITLE